MFPAAKALRPAVPEDEMGQRRGRGLAVRSRDPDDRPLEESVGELDLGDDRDAPRRGRVRFGEGRDPRAQDDEVGAQERFEPVASRLERDASGAPVGGPALEGVLGLLLADQDPRAPPDEEPAQGFAGLGEADDEDVLILEFHVYLNFRVVRLNRAKTMARIQKRMTTFSSGQPMSSK